MPLSVAFSDTRRFVVDEEFDVDGYAGASELGGPSTRRGDVLLTRSVVRRPCPAPVATNCTAPQRIHRIEIDGLVDGQPTLRN